MIRNERTKLTAGALNTAATSCFAIGVLTPIAAAFYGAAPASLPLRVVVVGVVSWFAAACVLHLAARWVLGGLKP
jgi:VIT1/CCC1 family predicted Fe2+/Mn2+ transporter